MRSTLLADRYARALQSVFTETTRLEAAAEVINTLAALYESDPVFRSAMSNPVLERALRAQVLDTALGELEAPPEVVKLLHTLLERNRMALLPALAERFQGLINEWMNRVDVTVVSAGALTPEFKHRISAAIAHFSGKTVNLECKVDPDIIGGLVVQILGNFIDFSLRTRLERLKEKLLSEETFTYGH
jgi:ATP synthase F1 delta subunit